MLVMGIDGGGSTLRIGVFDENLNVVAQLTRRENCNPSVRGKEAVRNLLQTATRKLLNMTPGTDEAIQAVGVGIAGADVAHSGPWLTQVLRPVLPNAVIVPTSDYEIALVGARGERYGALLLAGTGCISYGVNHDGKTARVGGWGYLLESEGSGYSIGIQAVKALVDLIDRQLPDTPLTARLQTTNNVPRSRDGLIAWMYSERKTDEIARLAATVLEVAAEGADPTANHIIDQSVASLVRDYNNICTLLEVKHLPVAFAGGLITNDTVYAHGLATALNLDTPPKPLAPPLVGAARLALLSINT